MLDFSSLLFAAALSGSCLSITIFTVWFSSRSSSYLLSTAFGILVLVAHVIAFWLYSRSPNPWLCHIVLALLTTGFLIIHHGASQYVEQQSGREIIAGALSMMVAAAVVTYAGYDGLGFVIAYLTSTILLSLTGLIFWRNGDQDHLVLLVVSLLSGACAITFALCALVLVMNGQWTLGVAPDNWAEKLNSIVAVICMSGLGALAVSLHHLKTAGQLKADALTDPLTDLMNRRALQSLYGERSFGPYTAIVMFDLDHFKKTNDAFGHPIGDKVLHRFAAMVKKHCRSSDDAFRLGGEEFALVMPRITRDKANDIASRICVAFGAEVVTTPKGPLRSTVSAGVGFGDLDGMKLDEVLAHADAALYTAKKAGRNCVVLADERQKAGSMEPALLTA